tara:strand:+ start:2386 stop:2595 length:210 start_codon:yes stop_codon:yes gene_type:complete
MTRECFLCGVPIAATYVSLAECHGCGRLICEDHHGKPQSRDHDPLDHIDDDDAPFDMSTAEPSERNSVA